VVNLFRFIDWVMILPKGLKQAFWTELQAYEKERQMPYITSVEEIGFARGLQAGEERERQRGEQRQRSLILRQLHRRVGEVPEAVQQQIEQLPIAQLEALGEALLDFKQLADLLRWLEALRPEQE
jgi:predicted transposase YdaD